MSEEPAPSPFKLPAAGPSAADVADRDLWEKTAEGSLAAVQAAAEKWRTGLAAFVTLVTGGLLIKGPEAADDLGDQWLLAISILGGSGLLLAVIGLWNALRAAAGSPAAVRYEDVAARHGSFRQFQIASAAAASNTLARARTLVGWSLALLGATVIVWWWAPTEPAQLVKINHGDKEVCGVLKSADGHEFSVKPAGTSKAVTVSFDDTDNVFIVDKC